MRRIDDEQRGQIVDLYYEGHDLTRIAEMVGVSDSFVSRLLIEEDLRDPRRVLDEREVTAICRMYAAGLTARGLAVRHGIHVGTVYDVLQRQGIPRRVEPLSDEETAAIVRLWHEEPNIYRIAQAVRRSRAAVLKVIRRAGLWHERPAAPRRRKERHPWSVSGNGRKWVGI